MDGLAVELEGIWMGAVDLPLIAEEGEGEKKEEEEGRVGVEAPDCAGEEWEERGKVL